MSSRCTYTRRAYIYVCAIHIHVHGYKGVTAGLTPRSRSRRRFNFINRNCCLYLVRKGARLIVTIPTGRILNRVLPPPPPSPRPVLSPSPYPPAPVAPGQGSKAGRELLVRDVCIAELFTESHTHARARARARTQSGREGGRRGGESRGNHADTPRLTSHSSSGEHLGRTSRALLRHPPALFEGKKPREERERERER
jgi:hypothetical protein